MNTARRVEAVVSLCNGLDQLLTAAILVHDQRLLSPVQEDAVSKVLDLIGLGSQRALRLVVGLEDVGGVSALQKEMEHELRWDRIVAQSDNKEES